MADSNRHGSRPSVATWRPPEGRVQDGRSKSGQGRQRLAAVVRGRVQGVGFRWSVQRLAQRLDLHGYAANRADGTVCVVAEGTPEALDELEDFLRRGPAGGRVDGVSSSRGPATGELKGFATK
jgi:acylphosphatase